MGIKKKLTVKGRGGRPEPSELGLFALVTKDVDIADSVSCVLEHQFVEEMNS